MVPQLFGFPTDWFVKRIEMDKPFLWHYYVHEKKRTYAGCTPMQITSGKIAASTQEAQIFVEEESAAEEVADISNFDWGSFGGRGNWQSTLHTTQQQNMKEHYYQGPHPPPQDSQSSSDKTAQSQREILHNNTNIRQLCQQLQAEIIFRFLRFVEISYDWIKVADITDMEIVQL